jgi:hypothetical protein
MSTAKFSTWLNPNGTENYKCRAWVNFDGTGTVAIRAAGNVASITDNGTGNYTVNFTTAMPDANYAAMISAQETIATDAFFNRVGSIDSCATGNVRVNTFAPNSATLLDVAAVHVTIFR